MLILMVEVLLVNYYCDEVIFVEKLLVYFMVLLLVFCEEVGSVGCDMKGLICLY